MNIIGVIRTFDTYDHQTSMVTSRDHQHPRKNRCTTQNSAACFIWLRTCDIFSVKMNKRDLSLSKRRTMYRLFSLLVLSTLGYMRKYHMLHVVQSEKMVQTSMCVINICVVKCLTWIERYLSNRSAT